MKMEEDWIIQFEKAKMREYIHDLFTGFIEWGMLRVVDMDSWASLILETSWFNLGSLLTKRPELLTDNPSSLLLNIKVERYSSMEIYASPIGNV